MNHEPKNKSSPASILTVQVYAEIFLDSRFRPKIPPLVIVEAPWDVTVSYHDGTSRGPQAILEASYQVDLFLKEIPDAWKLGVCMHRAPDHIAEENKLHRKQATQHIKRIESGEKIAGDDPTLATINQALARILMST